MGVVTLRADAETGTSLALYQFALPILGALIGAAWLTLRGRHMRQVKARVEGIYREDIPGHKYPARWMATLSFTDEAGQPQRAKTQLYASRDSKASYKGTLVEGQDTPMCYHPDRPHWVSSGKQGTQVKVGLLAGLMLGLFAGLGLAWLLGLILGS